MAAPVVLAAHARASRWARSTGAGGQQSPPIAPEPSSTGASEARARLAGASRRSRCRAFAHGHRARRCPARLHRACRRGAGGGQGGARQRALRPVRCGIPRATDRGRRARPTPRGAVVSDRGRRLRLSRRQQGAGRGHRSRSCRRSCRPLGAPVRDDPGATGMPGGRGRRRTRSDGSDRLRATVERWTHRLRLPVW